VISHIRQANVGGVCLENTHPFVRERWGQYWSFAHNGQLSGTENLPLGECQPVGTTDSERAFCWLLHQLQARFGGYPPAVTELAAALQAYADQLRGMGVFNMLLSDSRYLFAYCSTKLHWITREAPFGPAQLRDAELAVNFAARTTASDVVTVIATEPLTANENWQAMAPGQLLVLRDGRPVSVSSSAG
jgi:glutamine amidotransferase